MKREEILDAMEYLDAAFIEEADSCRGRRKWKFGAVAAAACLCICALAAYPMLQGGVPEKSSTASIAVSPGSEGEDGFLEGALADHVGFDESGCVIVVPESGAGESGPVPGGKAMISRYGSGTEHGDLAVENGGVLLSESLRAAMDDYGDTVRYRIAVEVFRDGTAIDNGSAEAAALEEKLADTGCIVAHESFSDGAVTMEYITLYAEREQVLRFPADGAHGYYLSLYDEALGLQGPAAEENDPYYHAERQQAAEEAG